MTVQEVLRRYLQHWDPLDVVNDLVLNGLSPDEYDGYVPELHEQLVKGMTIEGVETCLMSILTRMGMQYQPDRDRPIAEAIHKFFYESSGFRK